jgi:hypothetical protein
MLLSQDTILKQFPNSKLVTANYYLLVVNDLPQFLPVLLATAKNIPQENMNTKLPYTSTQINADS